MAVSLLEAEENKKREEVGGGINIKRAQARGLDSDGGGRSLGQPCPQMPS